MSPARRLQLEEVWRQRLGAAGLEYRRAAPAINESGGKPFKQQRSADSRDVMKRARAQEVAALKEYMRVLDIFTDLVAYGKMPPPDSGNKSEGAATSARPNSVSQISGP